MKSQLTLSDFQKYLRYDAESGWFYWTVSVANNRIKAGCVAGKYHEGYWRLSLFSLNWAAHQVAWLFIHGEWPKFQVDHINGNTLDNRSCNLRDVNVSTNQLNRRLARIDNKTTRELGVSFSEGRFRASIQIQGKRKWLGSFKTLEEAVEARKRAEPPIFTSTPNLRPIRRLTRHSYFTSISITLYRLWLQFEWPG